MTTAHDAHEPHHEGGHGHSPFVQHHYDDAQHQFDAGKLGIWLFLAQEVLFFSALFVAYVLYRVHHGELYGYAHKWLQVKFGAINTAVLIFSSLTAAWAVRCAQLNQRRGLILCIVLTLLCACTFLGIKYVEYSHKVHEHILFGRYFDPCVTPGEVELLTKNNECPGTKSTVEWSRDSEGKLQLTSDGHPLAGCYESSTIDQDPAEPGVQADCQVTEITREKVKSKDPKTGADKVDWVDKSKREIAKRCPEEHGEGGKEAHETCWRTSYQPAVCGDLTSPDDRNAGKALRPQVGILVEYFDGKERGEEIKIEAKCKPAPAKAAAPADPFATAEPTEKLGQKALQRYHIPTTEEEHEELARQPPPEHTGMFFTIYFAMTGLHGIHVLFGVFVFTWLLIRAIKGQFTPDYFGPVDYAALYWHIVDLIWIFLFPLLYLIH